MIPEDNTFLKAAAYVVFAAIGGAMGYIMRNIDAGTPIRWSIVAVQAVAAGFVGMLVYMVCIEFSFSQYWTGVVVGVCGWLGANTSIGLLQKLVYKKLGLSGNTVQPEPEKPLPRIERPTRSEE